MDLTRRTKAPAPLAESRRSSDFMRPVTTAGFSSTIPLVIGQQRIPTTVIRDGRKPGSWTGAAADNQTHYGLCEGPLTSVGKMFADKGTDVLLANSPGAGLAIAGSALPWVGLPSPGDATTTPDSRSFEVSSDLTLSGASATYLFGGANNDTGETAAGLPKNATEAHACVTGTGDTAKTFAVLWSQDGQWIRLFSRTGSGAWGQVSTITSASVAASLLPATGAVAQPQVAAMGSLVHVVWSCLDQAGEPVKIAHAWSTDGGATWTYGQSLTPQTKTNAAGVQRLQIALSITGEVWVSCHKRSTASSPTSNASCPSGVIVGYLPSNAAVGTTWILPDLTSRASGPGLKGELCSLDSAFGGRDSMTSASQILRAPSVLPLGGGKALLSCIYSAPGTLQAQLFVLPILADTLVRWDLPAAALNLVSGDTEPHSNVTSIPWLVANGYASVPMGWAPDGQWDFRNEGSTQIVPSSPDTFAVLYNHKPTYGPSPLYWYTSSLGNQFPATPPPAAHPDRMGWGAWRIRWGTRTGSSVVWQPDITELSTVAAPGHRASAFWNGSGQIFVAMGKPAAGAGGTYFECYSAAQMDIMVVTTSTRQAAPWISFAPATLLGDSVGYQFTALNGEALAIWREDEEVDTHPDNGLRLVSRLQSTGDVLPSVICKRLLVGDPLRGLNIPGLVFDDGPGSTWEAFDNYCKALGIRFSLALTSQQAAWPLVCDILESANAAPFRSQGLLKVFVRETATITANGTTYTPKPEHAGPVATIPAAHLRDGIKIEPDGMDAAWNRLTVNWKNRLRSYADQPTVVQDEGAVVRRGVIEASPCDWNWITTEQTALTCAWLRLRRQQRAGRTYSFAVDMRYMLHEPGDIVTIGDGMIPARPVRILSISEAPGGWREIEAEDVVVSTTTASAPGAVGGNAEATLSVASPVNLPIIFVALVGGLLQVFALLSAGAGWRGCSVQQSWDGATWQTVGVCSKQSPTGHLIQDMNRLRVRPGLRPHPGLRPGAADFALADFSESTVLPPWPAWGDFLAGNPGALLWVDGELMAYAMESDDGVSQGQCSVLRRGLYGTTCGPHPILSRVGVVTDAAFAWAVPPGRNGATCYLRFPVPGDDPAASTVYSVGIPA